jgi:hypothetical protein
LEAEWLSVHTVIESLSAYEGVRAKDPAGKRVWWTTSPFLLVHLAELREDVRSPEDGLDHATFNALAMASGDFAKNSCSYIQTQAAWADQLDVDALLAGQVGRLFFVTFYKGLLLGRVLSEAGNGPVVCVGDPDDPRLESLSLAYGRLDTLFARLAIASPASKIEVFKHVVPKEQCTAIDRGVRYRRLGREEKLLSLLNNTFSSFLYKGWRNLVASKYWPWQGVSLRLRPAKTIYILKDCELIEESFLGILLRGGRVRRIPKLPQPEISDTQSTDLRELDTYIVACRELSIKALQGHKLPFLDIYESCMKLVGQRLHGCCAAIQHNMPVLEKEFSRIILSMQQGDEILSSSINTIVDRLFASHCRKSGIRVNTVDHGVTLGLSEWSCFHAPFSGMNVGERAFYHCQRAVSVMKPHADGQIAHAVGLPKVTARPALRNLQRRLARRMLGISQSDHVVMIVCDLPRNNFIYGPHQDNDLQFLRKTVQVTETICGSYPASIVVLKLYPTQRYIDDYDFSGLTRRYGNLRVVKDVEFRFVRTAADLLITSSTQSTLGWVAGAGVPFIYLDFIWSRGMIDGLRMLIPGIQGLFGAILPDIGQVSSSPEVDMASVLLQEIRA